MKLYFATPTDPHCYPMELHLHWAWMEGLTEIELYRAVPVKLTDGYFWCKSYSEFGQDGDCGRHCAEYSPRNGRSGMCRHRSNREYRVGEMIKVRV